MGLRGHTAYGVYLLWGVIFAVPACLRILWAIITRPRAFFHRSNWSAMELPPLLEGLHHRMVDVAPGVALHCVSTSTDEHKDKPFMLLVHGFPGETL